MGGNSSSQDIFTPTNAQKVSFAVGDIVVVPEGQKTFDFAQVNKAEKDPVYGYQFKVTYHEKNQENMLQPMINPRYKKSGKLWISTIHLDSVIMNLKDQTLITQDIEQKIQDLLMEIFSSDDDSD